MAEAASDAVLDAVAGAIADHSGVDWAATVADPRLEADDRGVVDQLRIISGIAMARRHEMAEPVPARGLLLRPLWAAATALAALKVVFGILGAPAASVEASLTRWPIAFVVLFGAAGAALVAGGRKDRRLRSLGALFLVIASAFADPLLTRDPATVSAIAAVLWHLPADAFVPFALWWFVAAFPGPARTRPVRRIADAFLLVSVGGGGALLLANVALAWGPAALAAGPLRLFDRHAPALAYWPVLFCATLPAVPYLVWKARFDTFEMRRRVVFFVTAIAMALTPMLVAVIATPVFPALADPSNRQWIGIGLYLALLSLVPSTIYAVAVQHVMDVEFIVHKTMQHALARNTVRVASIAPLAYLAVSLYLNRALTVGALFGGARSISLIVASTLGFSVLAFRHELLRRVDRWFQVGTGDYAAALARLERSSRAARTLREIAVALAGEIEFGVHPTVVAVLIVNEELGRLTPLAGPVPALDMHSAIVDLLRSVQRDIQVNLVDGPLARLLPKPDRAWLIEGGVHALFPLIGSTGTLLGAIALGERRSGLPYTAEDRILITALSGAVSMRLENRWLHDDHAGQRSGQRAAAQSAPWQNEPATYCPQCSTVWPSGRQQCTCGGVLLQAALPLLVQGKFRVERFLGAGGMGVVYLAVDVTLDRKVAIKTLPRITPEHSIRLQREARAMAAVVHPNLALIFGAEQWNGTPLLIAEYLEGGTLSDRLKSGPLQLEEVIDLGIVLADVLDRMHESGVLHRDIKPSNIGYTKDGIPKLLDFGLATILDRSKGAEAWPTVLTDSTLLPELLERLDPSTTITITQQLVGTPLYLAPEALTSHRPRRSFDLWSLSLVLYEALAGAHPLGRGTAQEVLAQLRHVSIPSIRTALPQCPATVDAFFRYALAPAPEHRPPAASDLRNALQSVRASLITA